MRGSVPNAPVRRNEANVKRFGWVGAVLVTMACGVPQYEACGPENCAGCCTATGVCIEVPAASTCGKNGAQCGVCQVDQQCTSGSCRSLTVADAGVDAGVLLVDAGQLVSIDAGSDAGIDAGTTVVIDAGVSCPGSNLRPANLVVNGDFECTGGPAFKALGQGQVSATLGRTGQGQRLTVGAGLYGNEFSTTWHHRIERTGTYCVRAFVRGSASTITLRIYAGAGGAAIGHMFMQPGPLTSWQRLPPTLPALSFMANADDDVFFSLSDPSGTVGSTIEVDDLDLFRSEDGTCRDR